MIPILEMTLLSTTQIKKNAKSKLSVPVETEVIAAWTSTAPVAYH